MNRTGIFFIGASGYISTAVIAGALAMRKGLCGSSGMVTELPQFAGLSLVDPASFAFGGWDIRRSSPLESARNFFLSSQLPSGRLPAIEAGLAEAGQNIYPGRSTNSGRAIEHICSPGQDRNAAPGVQVMRRRRDMEQLPERTSLDCVVVVNLASTEP